MVLGAKAPGRVGRSHVIFFLCKNKSKKIKKNPYIKLLYIDIKKYYNQKINIV